MGEHPIIRTKLKKVRLHQPFFDSLRESYPVFDAWFSKKKHEICYITGNEEQVTAFMYLKIEDIGERYEDIQPPFSQTKRLKIGTLKIEKSGEGIGSSFVNLAKQLARKHACNEIYVTVPDVEQKSNLTEFLIKRKFVFYGKKQTHLKEEDVYVFSF